MGSCNCSVSVFCGGDVSGHVLPPALLMIKVHAHFFLRNTLLQALLSEKISGVPHSLQISVRTHPISVQ